MVENLFVKKNPLHDLLSNLNAIISTNESTQIITGHVIYNPAYTYEFQLKTTVKNLFFQLQMQMINKSPRSKKYIMNWSDRNTYVSEF